MRKLAITSVIVAAALAGCAGAVTKATGEQAEMRYRDYAGEPIDSGRIVLHRSAAELD